MTPDIIPPISPTGKMNIPGSEVRSSSSASKDLPSSLESKDLPSSSPVVKESSKDLPSSRVVGSTEERSLSRPLKKRATSKEQKANKHDNSNMVKMPSGPAVVSRRRTDNNNNKNKQQQQQQPHNNHNNHNHNNNNNNNNTNININIKHNNINNPPSQSLSSSSSTSPRIHHPNNSGMINQASPLNINNINNN